MQIDTLCTKPERGDHVELQEWTRKLLSCHGWMEADKKAGGEAQPVPEVRSGIHRQQLQSAVTAAAVAATKPPSPAAAGHRPPVGLRTWS